MKVLYVGDHRDSMNWGGRGQSIALHQLLATTFAISGVIDGDTVNDYARTRGQIGSMLPHRHYRFLRTLRGKHKLIEKYVRLEERLGARDFVSDQPVESADNVLRYQGKNPELARLRAMTEACDVVVINGEGSGVFSTPFRRDFFFYLAMAELALQLGKKVFYVNGILSDCPFTGRNRENLDAARRTLAKCNGVLVRDPGSLEFARREMPDVKADYIPDALFTWYPAYERFGAALPANGDFVIPPIERDEYFGKLDFSKPYVCLGGSSWAAGYQDEAVVRYLALLAGLRRLGCAVYLTQNCAGDRFLQTVAQEAGCGLVPWNTPIMMAGAILANARVFVSGRFHPTIFASLGGTPCVYLDAHSHKMATLQSTLEYDESSVFSALPAERDVDAISALAGRYLREGEPRRDRIRTVAARRCEEAAQLPARMLHSL